MRRHVFWKNSPCASPHTEEEEEGNGVQLVMSILVILAVVGIVFMLLRMKGPCGGEGVSAKVSNSAKKASGSELTSKEEVEEAIRRSMDGTPVLVMFHASWCGHCKTTLPEFKDCAKMCKDLKCLLYDIDADKALDKDSLNKYKIEGYPTISIFKNGSHAGDVPHTKRKSSDMKTVVMEYI